MATITLEQTLVTEVCISCGISFAIPSVYQQYIKENHVTFFCPNGHNQAYLVETEAEKLRKQLEAERKTALEMNERREALQRELNETRKAHEKKIKQVKRRAAAGTCQFCNRTFQNMARHMHTKHHEEVDAAQLK